MSRFRFRLEVIRQLRQRAQDAQRRVLADRVFELDRIAERIDGLRQAIEDADDGKRSVLEPARLDIELLRRHQLFRGWLDRNVVDASVEMRRHEERVARERAKLAEASRRLKVVEKLRERQWNRHQKQCQRAEQAAFDEVALQGYLRRQDDQTPLSRDP